ncbi:MAG: transketolase [Lautropia sp. SCN 69-89]|nr:MAG: transketolase [Lautropia sp. SCN 69-89]
MEALLEHSAQPAVSGGHSGAPLPPPATLKKMADAIRALSMDAVQQANSGHPGMPMGMAEIAVALWSRHLKHNPADPHWADRDRFVLSNGHGSMLLYSVLHLTGYALPIEELRKFRQLHSMTPGHPEVGVTPGVETTTGPLGQGLANAVGMALAERLLAARFNRDGFPVVDHFTWVFAGDGCMMEGVSHEACSLAGTLKLSKLVVFYDDNGISIDGQVEHWFRDDTVRRFEAYGWHVIPDIDGHDVAALDRAIALAREWGARGRDGTFAPTLIQCRTMIGKGSPGRVNTAKAHGEPLGKDEIAATRAAIDWPYPPFEIPPEVRAAWDARERGARSESDWRAMFERYSERHPSDAQEFERRMRGDLPGAYDEALDAAIAEATARAETIATRKASQNALNHFGPTLPELIGGSADLTGSNLTDFKGAGALRVDDSFVPGRHVNFGVREFGMSAILNGLALHGGFVPYGGTFLTFSDYARNAVRMSALMKQRVIFVFTHDSIGLGEDGPTHQPVEHAASLRLIPRLDVWRPCDPVESAVAWGAAIARRDGPSALLFSRQAVPFVTRSARQVDAIDRGAYVLRDAEEAHAVIIATGSEVSLALAARELLAADGIAVRIVSMPSTTVFDRQEPSYRSYVLPDHLPRIAVEAGVTDGWWKYGCDAVVGLDTFGESAPAAVLARLFGFTAENVADTVREALRRRAARR